MAVTNLMQIVVGAKTFVLVDNDSGKSYISTVNPLRFTVTKNGVALQKKYPSLRMACKGFAQNVMKSEIEQSIANQPARGPSATNTA